MSLFERTTSSDHSKLPTLITSLPPELLLSILEWVIKLDRVPPCLSVGWTLSTVCLQWAKTLMFQSSFVGIWSQIVLRRDVIELEAVGLDAVPMLARTLEYGYASIKRMLKVVFSQVDLESEDGPWLDGLKVARRRVVSANVHGFEGELLDMTLKLSRNRPLFISVSNSMAMNAERQPLPIPKTWLRDLIQHSARWRDVHLTIRKEDISTTLNLVNLHLPLLESLGMEICYTSGDWSSFIGSFGLFHHQPQHPGASGGRSDQTIQIPFTAAPVLQRLFFRCHQNEVIAVPLSRITHLKLQGARILDSESSRNASLQRPLHDLSASRNLTSLQIDTDALSAFYNALNGALHSPGYNTPALLPRLRHLCLTTPEPPSIGLGAPDSGYRDHYIQEATFRSITISNRALRSLEFRTPHQRARMAGRSICGVLNSLSQTGVELQEIRFRAAEGRCLSMVDWEAMLGSGSGAAVRGLEFLDVGVGVIPTGRDSTNENDLEEVSECLLEGELWRSGEGENTSDKDNKNIVPNSGYNWILPFLTTVHKAMSESWLMLRVIHLELGDPVDLDICRSPECVNMLRDMGEHVDIKILVQKRLRG
ncbi:hypothetical protein PQX77_009609 [Marasmius sp. AFHP31]|nr:hypothetical protein PQX77_009609 [Marasmius sp. AFHP31]